MLVRNGRIASCRRPRPWERDAADGLPLLIQHVVDEARETDVEHFIFVTGRNKGVIEDHFTRAEFGTTAPIGVLMMPLDRCHLSRGAGSPSCQQGNWLVEAAEVVGARWLVAHCYRSCYR